MKRILRGAYYWSDFDVARQAGFGPSGCYPAPARRWLHFWPKSTNEKIRHRRPEVRRWWGEGKVT